MTTEYLELSINSRRLLDAISTATSIQKEALNNDNKETLNRIVAKLLAEMEIALVLDKQQPIRDRAKTTNDRTDPIEHQGERFNRLITDRPTTTDRPTSTGKSVVDIPAHQPEVTPIGNIDPLRHYIICNDNFTIDLFNDDLLRSTLTQHKKTSGSRLDNPERASEQQQGET